jgi:hypothetical protein
MSRFALIRQNRIFDEKLSEDKKQQRKSGRLWCLKNRLLSRLTFC